MFISPSAVPDTLFSFKDSHGQGCSSEDVAFSDCYGQS